MPRKQLYALPHVKTVKSKGARYLYFNTGEIVDGKARYIALGKEGDPDIGARHSNAMRARSRADGTPSALSLPQLVQRYERSPDYTKKSQGTQRTYSVYLKRLATEFNAAPASGLEQRDLYKLMDVMADRPAAADMMLLAGAQMYAWAVKRKYVLRNPFVGIDREDWEARQYEPWPENVLEEALADSRLGLPVALLYFSAQRIGDCCNLRWADVGSDGIQVTQQKTRKSLLIPVHGRLAEAFANAPRKGATILADAKGRPMKDQTIRSWIAAFGEKRGLKLVPHGLRKNAVNALLEAGCSIGEVSAISGQSLQMVEHYARRRNSQRMGRAGMSKWERNGERETLGKTAQETADL
jgi:integrase